jgi:excinuclease UvrABC ATPase subunit
MSVHLDGKTIRDCLDMTVSEAYAFFRDKDGVIANILNVMIRVGMSYIRLGQKTPTISGGESQRIKLARELAKGKAAKGVLYILDEPSTGLSFYDCEKLLKLLNELVDMGNSVILTEHDTNMLSNCDWIVEMGPAGGRNGGRLIAEGTPAELKKNPASVIGRHLKTGGTQ